MPTNSTRYTRSVIATGTPRPYHRPVNGSQTSRGDWRDGLPAQPGREQLPPVRRVEHDSRLVDPGDLFVCVPGQRSDGHEFAEQAVARGAVALVVEPDRAEAMAGLGVPLAVARDPRATLADVAAAHEGYPGRELSVVGITGTDGKSTTAFLALAALESAGLRSGLLSTIESRIAGQPVVLAERLTTQEAPVVQRLLGDMVEARCTHAVVEATSHGLAMHRLDHCHFEVGVFTNLSPDHLDFHGDLEHYRQAKGRLFEMLSDQPHGAPRRTAVLNADDANWRYFAGRTRARVVTFGRENTRADVLVDDVMEWSDGSTFTLVSGDDSVEASVRLPGSFNVQNAAAAITAGAALGLDVEALAAGVAGLADVPGRMERIPGAPFEVIVDYAHTPRAMRLLLGALRPTTSGRLFLVFGCAGERSVDRRSGLGAVAAELADFTVLTEEDPRSEPAEAIIGEIAQAMQAAGAVEGGAYERIVSRREAIDRALALAGPGDLVVIAGKGHEQSIERAEGAEPWDDREMTRQLIEMRFA